MVLRQSPGNGVRYFSTTSERSLQAALAHAADVQAFRVDRHKVAGGHSWQISANGLGETAAQTWPELLTEIGGK